MLIDYLRSKDCMKEKTYIRIKKSVLPIGLFTLVIAIILSRYFPESGPWAFAAGFLMGLSIVVSIFGIIVVSRDWIKK